MRRSMKRLKTFKQPRTSDGASTDPNVIPLEAIGGKICFFYYFFRPLLFPFGFICKSFCNWFFFVCFVNFFFHIPEQLHVCMYILVSYNFLLLRYFVSFSFESKTKTILKHFLNKMNNKRRCYCIRRRRNPTDNQWTYFVRCWTFGLDDLQTQLCYIEYHDDGELQKQK